VECFLRNPNCTSGKRCFRSTCVDRRLAITRSNNFPTMLRRLIGLYELGSVGGLLGLRMGMTLARSQVLGKSPLRKR
jgi:hypothetical protein